MTAEELGAILRELEKHPRIGSIAVGDLRVTFRDAGVPADVPAELADGEPDSLELPDGVFDPRAAIDRVYARARERVKAS